MATADERTRVRRCLIGLDEYLAKIGDTAAQNAVIDDAVAYAQAKVRRELHVELGTVRIAAWPTSDMTQGAEGDYDVTEEPYDYSASQYRSWGYLRLRRRPVQSIQRVRVMLGPDNPVLTYPADWIRLDKKPGQVRIVPTPGSGWSGMVLSNGMYYLPYLSAGWIMDNVPHVIAVDYTAGLGDAAGLGESADPNYVDLQRHLFRLAAGEVLFNLSNAVNPGIQSTSLSEDGASESVSYTRGGGTVFAAQIKEINDDWEAFKRTWSDTEVGIEFAVL